MKPTDDEEYQECLNAYNEYMKSIYSEKDEQEYQETIINFEIKTELQKVKKREYAKYYRAINNDKCICEKCGGHYTKLTLKAHLNTQKHNKN